MIVEKILALDHVPRRIMFLVWARTPCKSDLAKFAMAAKELESNVRTVALVDNILPRALLGRSLQEQRLIDDTYKSTLLALGFEETYLLTDLQYEFSLSDFFGICRKFTQNEFRFVIPSHKIDTTGNYSAVNIVEFAWQVDICRYGLEKLNCDSIIAGMATRHFYYTARKQFPKINIYFTQGKSPLP